MAATPLSAPTLASSSSSSKTQSQTPNSTPSTTNAVATSVLTSTSTTTTTSTTLISTPPLLHTDVIVTPIPTSSTSTNTASSTTSTKLQPPPDPLIEKFEKASKLLEDGNQEEARSLFIELIAELKEELKTGRPYLNQYVNCHIRVALSYPESSEKRKEAALAAKKIIDDILAKTLLTQTETTSLIEFLYKIRKFYISIDTLVPAVDEKFHQQIAVHIAFCTKYIPVLDNFDLILHEADTLLGQNNHQEARKLVLEALPSLSEDTPEINLAKIKAHTFIAETFDKEGIDDSDQHAETAKNLALTIYENRGFETPLFYIKLIDLFSRLKLLLNDDVLIEKLEACTNVFTASCARSLSSSSIPPAEWFKLAYGLINIKRLAIAQLILLELLKSFENNESLLAMSAQCHIGLAYTYPDEPSGQQTHLNQAKTFLDHALEHLKNDPSEETIEDFLNIKALYRTIKDLGPNDLLKLHGAIIEKIKICTDHIPPLNNFYDELKYAQSISSENCEKAIKIVSTALKTLTEDKLAYNLARAKGYIFIAEMVSEKATRDQNANLALTFALKAYENNPASFKKKQRPQISEQLIELFLRLSKLLPDNATIKEKFAEYMHKPHQPISHKDRGKNDLKVSKEPAGDRWKYIRRLGAFFFATTVILGIGILGRRCIKIN